MPPAQSLQAHQAKLRLLASQLTEIGFIVSGSVVSRYMPCGKPGCRCQADPPQLHGPYWQWSKSVNGKTTTRRLTESQAGLYQEWIANRRRLTELMSEMEKVSQQALPILLLQDNASAPTDARQNQPSASSSASGPRITKSLAQSLVDLAEQLEPVADAAQQWLDAKDGGDREMVIDARSDLEAALTQADALFRIAGRLSLFPIPAQPKTSS